VILFYVKNYILLTLYSFTLKNKKPISKKMHRASWVFLAFFCLFFSGPIKKVIQFYADQKLSQIIPINTELSRSSSQVLRDGYREKHEMQDVVIAEHSQLPAPYLHSSAHLSPTIQVSSVIADIQKCNSSFISYKSHEAVSPPCVPDYLLFHRLNV